MKVFVGSTLLVAVVSSSSSRKLQDYTPIAGYTPLTDVRDQLRIDLDVAKIMELYEEGTDQSIAAAKKIYEEGAFSKSVSYLTISGGLATDIAKGTKLKGLSASSGGSDSASTQEAVYVDVFAYDDAEAGATELSVQYVDENCYVGANPDPVVSGCLASSGTLSGVTNTSITVTYEYDVLTDTSNVYNVKLFTQPSEYSFDGATTTVDFQKYVDFYGSDTFNDDIIQAIFAGTSINFSTGKSFDFSGLSTTARAEILETATGYMAVRNYVFRELEHAIYLCETGNCDENSCYGKPAVHEVDEAVAFYVGSLEGSDGSGEGVLTYDMANNRAEEFGTIANGVAAVNSQLISVFKEASDAIVAAECQGGQNATIQLAQLMTVPLIQSLLKYTFLTTAGGSETNQAERVAAALNLMPLVAACSADDADTIYANTMIGASSVDYNAVQQAIANNYGCLGVTASDVGTPPTEDDSADSGDAEPTTTGDSNSSDANHYMPTASIAALLVVSLFA